MDKNANTVDTAELYPGMQLSEPIDDVLGRIILNLKDQYEVYGGIDYARWDQNHNERSKDTDFKITHKSVDLIAKKFGFTHAHPALMRWAFVHGMAMQRQRELFPKDKEPKNDTRRRDRAKMSPIVYGP
jgi:hypothetical protein